MKKIAIYLSICIVAFASIWYAYYQYKAKKSDIDTNNLEYDNLLGKEIVGNDLASLINKTVDKNEKNNIKKNALDLYIENDSNSIKIDLKFKQSDKTYPMESIYNNQTSEFVHLYGQAMFKCTKLEYHKSTKYVKYLYFEEI